MLSGISGYMMSKSSWIGGIGMRIFYKEYTFLNTWWQGALATLGLYILLFIIHFVLQRVLTPRSSGIFNIIAIIIAIAGLYLTYHDFRHDFSHRLMGERFHIGFYLFWTGWIFIGLNFLFSKKKPIEISRKDEATE
ncbi:MAG: hypothetical protein BGO69_19905 [Bacteroidetes bacterium 46-16]|nr:MAG: hypothetical protein BGO69_19905 [Bacteroidetes bacterium 46-16]